VFKEKPFLIAEIGMNHNGSMATAKELIRAAHESGADIVKGQAFMARDVKGSMPAKFYEDRQLDPMQCIALIAYARDLGTDLFFSIFSREYEGIKSVQKWHKFSASQSKNSPRLVERFDRMNVIASVNTMTMLPKLHVAHVLYACPYLTEDPKLSSIEFLTEYYGRQVGYSDHTVGVDWCLRANRIYGARVIEKHFTLTRDIYFEGKQFRDAVHGALPHEFEQLARGVK
jgi:sialic acid synthase SpsE